MYAGHKLTTRNALDIVTDIAKPEAINCVSVTAQAQVKPRPVCIVSSALLNRFEGNFVLVYIKSYQANLFLSHT
jgi:hypothetical protein